MSNKLLDGSLDETGSKQGSSERLIYQKYNNIVIFAAGGGNDIFSAIAYIKSHLCKYSFQNIALIGLLGFTPFHSNSPIHLTEINVEPPIIVPSKDMCRYLPFHKWNNNEETVIKIYTNESVLPDIINNLCLEITKYRCLSPKYSAIEQAGNLSGLFDEWGFKRDDTILNIVDFGGDILTDGNQPTIISPGLDAYTLAIVSNMPYKSTLTVCFPGVDGELSAEYLEYRTSQSNFNEPIDKELWELYLTKLYDIIKDTRPGNTIPNMLKILTNNYNGLTEQSNLTGQSNLTEQSNLTGQSSLTEQSNLTGQSNLADQCNLTNQSNFVVKINKHWNIGNEKKYLTRDIAINMSLQSSIYIYELNNESNCVTKYNPFVKLFLSEKYNLKTLFEQILLIYKNQILTQDISTIVQSSDLHLQYLRKDTCGNYTNKHLILDGSQEVMLINILPYGIVFADNFIDRKTISNDDFICGTVLSHAIIIPKYTGDANNLLDRDYPCNKYDILYSEII